MAEFRGALYVVAGDSIYKIIETVSGYSYSLLGTVDLNLIIRLARFMSFLSVVVAF